MNDNLTPKNLRQCSDGELPAEILADYPVGKTSTFDKSSYLDDVETSVIGYTTKEQMCERGNFLRDDENAIFTGQLSPGFVLTWQHIVVGLVILCSLSGFLVWNISSNIQPTQDENKEIYYIINISGIDLTIQDEDGRILGSLAPNQNLKID